MRLFDTTTGRFKWVKDPQQVRYAVLSHVWSKEGDHNYVPEQTYQEVCQLQRLFATQESVVPYLCQKIRRFCEVAKEHGISLAWADTSCIDKTNHAELSEAITSMYSWYYYAEVCYVFLSDVSGSITSSEGRAQFRGSRWHGRGWTLQELLAPRVALFLDYQWNIIGSKRTLAHLITQATGIEHAVLTHSRSLEDVSVATRMSWAAHRETTYVEDEAYSLMGIFGIYISPAYGEKQYAFIRFQEELLKRNPDQSLFVWGTFMPNANITPSRTPDFASSPSSPSSPSSVTFPSLSSQSNLLAWSPKDFKFSTDITSLSMEEFADAVGPLASANTNHHVFTPTAHGIRANFLLLRGLVEVSGVFVVPYLALLACRDTKGRLLALLLHPQSQHSANAFFVGSSPTAGPDRISVASSSSARVTTISPDIIRKTLFKQREVYLRYPRLLLDEFQQRDVSIRHLLSAAPGGFKVSLAGWSLNLLKLQGYNVNFPTAPIAQSKFSTCIQISGRNHRVVIYIRRCTACNGASRPGALRVDVSLSHTGNGPSPSPVQELPVVQHSSEDPAHVSLWTFRSGTATSMVPLNEQKHITLTLTVAGHNSEPRSPGESARTSLGLKSLQLSVELATSLPRSLSSLSGSIPPTPLRPSTPVEPHSEPPKEPWYGTVDSLKSGSLSPGIIRTSSPAQEPCNTYEPIEDDAMIVRTCLVIEDIPPHFPLEEPLGLIAKLTGKTPYAWTCKPNKINPKSIIVDFRTAGDARDVKESLDGYMWRGCCIRLDYKRLAIDQPSTIFRPRPAHTHRSSESAYSLFPSPEPEGTIPPPSRVGTTQLAAMSLQDSPSSGSTDSVSATASGYLTFTPTYQWVQPPSKDLDLNDPWVLETYIRVMMFQNDPRRPSDGLVFPRTLSSEQRYTVHLLAQKLEASAESTGSGTQRRIVVHTSPSL